MSENNFEVCDYAVAFVDLLGQRASMPGRQLPEDPDEAVALIKGSVGRIIGIQDHLETFYKSYSSRESVFSQLPKEFQEGIPDAAPGELKWQYFSDGLVIYVPLGEGLNRAPATSIYSMLMASGCLLAVGLAGKSPLRIGIDVAWAVEYRPNQLYGAALAYSYAMESEFAKWPRVAIGEGLVAYLQHYGQSDAGSVSSRIRSQMANACLEMIGRDEDKVFFLDYFGPVFSRFSSEILTNDLRERVYVFAAEQLGKWTHSKDTALIEKYRRLVAYLEESHA